MNEKLEKSNVQEIIELNMAQKGMLYHYLKDVGKNIYNVQLSLQVDGDLKIDVLKEAFEIVQSKNAALRSVFRWEKITTPIQIILKTCPVEFIYNDLSQQFAAEAATEINRLSRIDQDSRFDLKQLPFKVRIIKSGKQSFTLNITNHHILYDGWSTGVFLKELFQCYRDINAGSTPEFKAKASYKKIQTSLLKTARSKASLQFWQNYLDEHEATSLFSKGSRTSNEQIKRQQFSASDTGIEAFSKKHKVTQASVIYAAYGILLQKYTATSDVMFGTVVSNRDAGIEGIDHVIGNFINTIPLRLNDVKDKKLSAVVANVNEDLVNRSSYSTTSLLDIKEESDINVDNLYDSIIAIENYPLDEEAIKGNNALDIKLRSVYENTNFPLVVTVFFKDKLEIEFVYKTDLVSDLYIRSLASNFISILEHITQDGARPAASLSLSLQKEEHALLEATNDTHVPYPKDKTVLNLFEMQVEKTPDNIALIAEGKTITYKELNEKSGRIASFLHEKREVRPSSLVGVMLEREADLIPVIFGILKAGGAYVPIDPDYPTERINSIIEDAGLKALITRRKYLNPLTRIADGLVDLDEVSDEISTQDISKSIPQASGNDLAYVIYTSGSTGKPKGVMIEHHSVVNRIQWMQNKYPITADDVLLQKTPIVFDVSVWELFWWSLTGASLCLLKPNGEKDPREITKVIKAHKVTTIHFVPSMLNAFLFVQGDGFPYQDLASLRQVFTSGEALKPKLVKMFSETVHKYCGTRLINLYGPTEATVDVSYYECSFESESALVPIGKPIDNTTLYVLDQQMNVLPLGVAGELHIAGAGLARGYLNRKELTVQKFVKNPYVKGGVIYKTGDLARWLPDGNIEFLGRMDTQVKIRGFRIELGEIEAELLKDPSLKEVTVLAKGEDANRFLVAYYVSEHEQKSAELKNSLGGRLPGYMIPDHFVGIDSMPVNANGKLDRKALPEPVMMTEVEYVAPSNDVERELVDIWSAILNREKTEISVTQSFMELGGHSLRIILMLNRVFKQFNVLVPVNEVFEHSSVRALGKYMLELEKVNFSSLTKAPEKAHYKLSAAQKRLYFLYEFDKSSLAYNGGLNLLIEGKLDIDRLEKIIQELISRHEILRSSFTVVSGEPLQSISPRVDFRIEHFQTTEDELKGVVSEFTRPFDLEKAPLIRAGLIKLTSEKHVLMVDMHHIISDGMSGEILIKEFVTLYNGESLPPLNLQYKDYAEWQQTEDRQEAIAKHKGFWLNEFSEEVETLDLPTDFVRPPIKNYEGSSIHFEIDPEQTKRLKGIAESEGTTLFTVLLSVYNVFLSRLSNLEDIVIGTPVAGRQHPDLESIIGMFVNTLPLRNYPKSESNFTEFLLEVKARVLACFDNQSVQYEELISELNLERDTSRNPLFDAEFAFQNFEEAALEIPGLKLERFDRGKAESKFDLTLTAKEIDGCIFLDFEYSTQLFQEETIKRFITYFGKIVSAVTEDCDKKIGEIEILTASEKAQLLSDLDYSWVGYPEDKTITALFNEQVQRTPNNVALTFENESITYAELDRRTDQLALLLRENGVKSNSIVGLLIGRSMETVIGMLSILKAGGAYLPIDIDYPQERISYMIEDSGMNILLTTKAFKDRLVYDFPIICIEDAAEVTEKVEAIAYSIHPSDLCYVIYTSGTTGNPKGVMVEHRNVVRLLFNDNFQFDFGSSDVWTMFHSHCFDVSVWEIYGALLFGGKLIIVPKMIARDPKAYLGILSAENVTILNQTPSAFYNLIQEEFSGSGEALSLRYAVFAGEALSPWKLKKWKAKYKDMKLVNMFGTTETTVHATYKEIGEQEIEHGLSNVGKPIPTLSVYILNRSQQLVPQGVIGELYIGGAGVSRGYLRKEALTREKFIQNPFDEQQRLYRTGDLARILGSGEIEYIGRIDSQIQLRGFRIELGEIESHLAEYDRITDIVVLAQERSGDKFLVAYYVSGEALDISDLRSHLSDRLPDYMIPSYFVHLAALPLTSNGKLDPRSLPAPKIKAGEDHIVPETKEERLLAEVWSAVLGVEGIGVTDNFFVVGGDSIKSIQISSRMRNAGYEVTVQDIFTHQTIRQLAPKLKVLVAISDQSTIEGIASLSPIQRWLFDGPTKDKHHYNHSVMLNFPEELSEGEAVTIFEQIQAHHDALRMVFRKEQDLWSQVNMGTVLPVSLEERDFRNLKNPTAEVLKAANEIQSGIDLANGPLMKLGLFHMKDGSRLLIVIHHLVVDGVSWRILFEDIESLYQQLKNNEPLSLPLKTDSFLSWSSKLQEYSQTRAFQKARQYWDDFSVQPFAAVERDYPSGKSRNKDSQQVSFELGKVETSQLLTEVHSAFHTQINDILLAALLLGIKKQYGHNAVTVDLEGHGREPIHPDVNVGRTVGWFTSIYPVLLSCEGKELAHIIKQVKEGLRSVPNHGIDNLLYKYLDNEAPKTEHRSQIAFNYLGQFDSDTKGRSFVISDDPQGFSHSQSDLVEYDWNISGIVRHGQLEMALAYGKEQYNEQTITSFMGHYEESLREVIDYCRSYDKTELTPSDLTYKELSIAQLDELQHRYAIEDIYPLSPMQEAMFFHSLMDSDSAHYFEQMTFDLKGALDINAVENSINELMERHDVFRTVFLYKGYVHPLQTVLKERKVDFTYEDLREDCKRIAKEELIKKYKQKDISRKFDLGQDILIRVIVLRVSEDEYTLIWSYHHILMDGWCMGIIFSEFKERYSSLRIGEKALLSPVTPYSKYISWLQDRDEEKAMDYWKGYLTDYDSLATLPFKKTSPSSEDQSYNLKSKRLTLDKDHVKSLNDISKTYNVTLNTIIQSAWGILLSRYNNVEDVVFGAVVSGRPSEVEEVENMVGLFINTVPVRISYRQEDTIGSLFQKLQEEAMASAPYHNSPLSKVQLLNDLGRDLLDHIILLNNYPLSEEIEGGSDDSPEGFRVSNVEVYEQSFYDFYLLVVPGEELQIDLSYNSNKYDGALIARVKEHLFIVIEQIITNCEVPLSAIDIISEAEQHEVLNVFNNTSKDFPRENTLMSLFKEQVGRTPSRIAVDHNGTGLTYENLYERAAKLSSLLRSKGLEGNKKVALYMPRSIDMLSSILAVFHAGGAYVPIDVNYPGERVGEILANSESELILIHSEFIDQAEDIKSSISTLREILVIDQISLEPYPVNEPVSGSPDDLAYIIYTSGTTGKPKGVMIHQLGMINHLYAKIDDLSLFSEDIVAQTASPCFDISVWQFLSALLVGGKTYIIDGDKILEPKKLVAELEQGAVTIFESVPSLITTFLDGFPPGQGHLLNQLRWMIPTGEALTVELVKKWYSYFPDIPLLNAYGPTEASDDVTHYVVPHLTIDQSTIPIGRPVQNTHIYVLDKHLNLCPIGVEGEICVAGLGVGKGYWRNEEKTQKAFIPNPFAQDSWATNYDTLYKTGDIGYFLEDGNIVCLGRIDEQVKIRGNRIELGEIESILIQADEVELATVLVKERQGDKFLVAYYISGRELEISLLKDYLSERLPGYMVPSYFMRLESFPLTTNGKLNKKAFPNPELKATNAYVPPSNEVEEKLQEIWAEILQIDKDVIGINESFFELGGHSLKVTQLTNKINKSYNVEVPIREIFQKETIQNIADYLIVVGQVECGQPNDGEIIEITI